MEIQSEIKKEIQTALAESGFEAKEITLEHPADMSYGDFSTNVALALAKQAKQSPRELAGKLAEILTSPALRQGRASEFIEKIEVAGAGFINFFLKPQFFAAQIGEIIKTDDFGKSKKLSNKKVMVEYTDPNPFKEFHIGHLMSNAIGESISHIVSFQGGEVKRACWQGDVGLHVAKAIWGAIKKGEPKNIEEWGKAYTAGAAAYEENEAAKKEIADINTKIYERSDEKINALYDAGRKISLAHFEEIYKKLGTKFDYYFFEGLEGREGEAIVKEFLKKGIFEESDGAIVFKGEKFGLHTRVFINSKGLPTYEAKELGLNKKKFEVEPDLSESIIITGNEQNDYFKVLLKVLSLIYPPIGEKTKHIAHGMLRFASGKMSSRKGNVITGESLLSEVEKLVLERIKDREFSEEERKKVAAVVAVGAIKYSILKQTTGSDIIYDFEKSISFEGDSGPYLQYSYARAVSVLNKAGVGMELPQLGVELPQPGILERLLVRFPEVVERSLQEYAPHYIATYLIELAGAFNSFYAQNKILDAGDKTPYRLALTKALSIVLKNGLWLLGIEAPEKM